jgi:hypothetical protein
MTSGALCRRMKTQPDNEALKDVRVVVRVDKPTAVGLSTSSKANQSRNQLQRQRGNETGGQRLRGCSMNEVG